jgi:hypothetical protein
MPGPPPKHPEDRVRRNRPPELRPLPPTCDIDAPAWPSGPRASKAKSEVWGELWSLPIANWWHQQCISPRIVQRYVIAHLEAIRGDHGAASQAARLERDLGLTPEALSKLRLEVVADAPATPRRTERITRRPDPRLTVVDGERTG